jgi:hypothetical protein
LTAEFAGKLDSAINAVISPHFRAFVTDVIELGMELNKKLRGELF